MDILLSRIIRYLNGVITDDRQYRTALFMVEHYQELRCKTLEEIVKESEYTEEDIMTFIGYLGYHDYEDFRERLMMDQDLRSSQMQLRLLHTDIDGMISDIENQDLHSLTAKMQNVFEPGIISQYPVIQEIKDLMEANGALKAMMSGSGPTVFGIFDDRSKLREATEALRNSHLAKTVFATQIYNKK